MILHFSHIGLTDGLTFMIPFRRWVPAARLWLPLRPPLPSRGHASAQANGGSRTGRTPDGSNSEESATGPRAKGAGTAQPAVATGSPGAPTGRASGARCQGVRTRGPSAVAATVNSKWAAG